MDVKVVGNAGKTEMLCFFLTEERSKEIKAGKRKAPKPVADAIKAGDFAGETDQVAQLCGDGQAKRMFLVGLGKKAETSTESVRRASSIAAGEAVALKLKELSVVADNGVDGEPSAAAEGAALGMYDYDKYKKKKAKKLALLNVVFSGNLAKANAEARKAVTIAEGTNMARDWTNEPSDVLNPMACAELAQTLAKAHGIKCTVLDEKELKRLGMNLMLSVCAGSRFQARLVLLEYSHGSGKPVVLLGKGVTFDSGGLNLKPSGYIETMKSDKAGAMTVLATMVTLARLKAKVNAIGVMALVENMIGPNASKPGAIVKSYDGKTVEIADTDAEGRLVLADALAYAAKRYKPKLLLDLATLTGSVLVTFGEYVAAVLGTDDKEAEALFKAGQRTYERVWRLPLYKEYEDEMKGDISDLRNVGYKLGRYAGTITGGAFLKQFTGKAPWLHIDIAGTSWFDKPRYYTPKGATGFGVRLLADYLTSGK